MTIKSAINSSGVYRESPVLELHIIEPFCNSANSLNSSVEKLDEIAHEFIG